MLPVLPLLRYYLIERALLCDVLNYCERDSFRQPLVDGVYDALPLLLRPHCDNNIEAVIWSARDAKIISPSSFVGRYP